MRGSSGIPHSVSSARRIGIIPVPFTGPKAQRAAITAAREALRRGEVVAIMPEGQLTRTGFLGPFYRGLEVILKGFDDVPVVPAALDNLWGSIWSFQGGTTVRKRPVGLRRRVAVAFGPPLTGPPSLFQIRLAIQEAHVDAREFRGLGPLPLETIDRSLPHLEHPELGLLAASTHDYDQAGVTQPGQRPGSVGLALPGVALRVVDESGRPLRGGGLRSARGSGRGPAGLVRDRPERQARPRRLPYARLSTSFKRETASPRAGRSRIRPLIEGYLVWPVA